MSARKKLALLIITLVTVATVAAVLIGDITPTKVNTQVVATRKIKINDRPFEVEIADTQEQRTKGLGGRSGLDKNKGMLFVFDTAGDYCFWMKDVSFPIDILWFDDNQKLVHKVSPALPESYPERFCPPVAARYVAELSAGTSEGLETGATLEL